MKPQIRVLMSDFLFESPTPSAAIGRKLLTMNTGSYENIDFDYFVVPQFVQFLSMSEHKKRLLRAPFSLPTLVRKYDIVHSPLMTKYFKKLLNLRNPDIYHIHTAHGVVPSHEYHYLDRDYDDMSPGLQRSIYPINSADTVVSVSHFMKEILKQKLDVDSEVIYNGIDIRKYHPSQEKMVCRRHNIEEQFVLFIGRDTRKKRFDLVCDVAKNMPETDFAVRIVGDINNNDVPENVTLLPYLSEEEIIQLYSAADVFLFPSEDEPFGLVTAEAMACETPVVGHTSGATSEIVEDGVSGFIVENNVSDIVGKLNVLLSDHHLKTDMGSRARKRIQKNFTIHHMAKQYYRLYEQVY